MKNKGLKVVSLALLSLVLGMTGCSNNNSNASSVASSEQKESIASSSEAKSEESKSSSSSEKGKSALFSRIEELAENVDTAPSIFEEENNQVKSAKRKANNDGKDISHYQGEEEYITSMIPASFLNVDNQIEILKKLKTTVVTNVRMLDKWIRLDMYQDALYRIRYDEALDTAYFEEFTDYNDHKTITSIISKYDKDGNIVITGYKKEAGTNGYSTCYGFDYHENSKMTYISKTQEGSGAITKCFLVNADLSMDNPLITGYDASRLDQGDRYVFDIDKVAYQAKTDDDEGIFVKQNYQTRADRG